MSITEEVWKDVKNYKGYYQISNKGRIRSLTRDVDKGTVGIHTIKGTLLKPRKQVNGYLFISLNKLGKGEQVLMHRLVAFHFLETYEEGLEVNHIDRAKTNNCVDNLEWVTHQKNVESYHSKVFLFTTKEGYMLCIHNLSKYCRKFGMSPGSLHNVHSGKEGSYRGLKRWAGYGF